MTRKKILSRSKCFVLISLSMAVIILSKEMMHNEDFLTEKIGNRKMSAPTKNTVLASQVRKDLNSDVEEGQGEDRQLGQEGGGGGGSGGGGGQ